VSAVPYVAVIARPRLLALAVTLALAALAVLADGADAAPRTKVSAK